MNEIKKCPRCGAEPSPGAVEGVCPRCAAALLQATQTELPGEGRGSFTPPTVAELAAKFPQLEILELIGRGGMGAVYKARQKELDRLVALKILPPDIGRDATFAERFAREARALAKLNHPGIVTIYDSGRADGLYFFLMEFVDGMNLRELLHNGRVAPREALAIVPQICDALQFAHDHGIVHRDIKPENLLIDRRGRVKVADFGLAKLMGMEPESVEGQASLASPSLTEAGKVMGTPNYMSPEQVEHPAQVDHRADIYALGVVFYQMLTGELPDKPLQPPSSKVQLDVRLDEVVLRALEKQPERRYQQASVLKTQVETISRGATGPAVAGSFAPNQSWEYKSEKTLWGRPWLHVAVGVDPATGRALVARGIIAIGGVAHGVLAIGGRARGVVAIGGLATGGLAFGGLSLGIISYGGLAVGLIALGGGAFGLLGAIGGLAAAPLAVGGLAIGVYAMGGLAWGLHVVDALHRSSAATAHFEHWGNRAMRYSQISDYVVVALMVGIGIGIPLLQKRLKRTAPAKDSRTVKALPFFSSVAWEIYGHMTAEEKRGYLRFGTFYSFWNAATFFLPVLFIMILPLPVPLNWVLASVVLLVGLAFYPVWWKKQARLLCATEWARGRGYQPEALRMFAFGSTGLMLLGAVLLAVVGILWSQVYHPDGTWQPWLSEASLEKSGVGGSACVTEVGQYGQTVWLRMTCDRLPPAAVLSPSYSGPLIELPYRFPAAATNVDCLVTTAPHSEGQIIAGTNNLSGQTNFTLGFVLPDEVAAATAVKLIQEMELNQPHGVDSLLFGLRRTLGKDSHGKVIAEEIYGSLNLSAREVAGNRPASRGGSSHPLSYQWHFDPNMASATNSEPASALQVRLVVEDAVTNIPTDTVAEAFGTHLWRPLRLARDILLDGTAVERAGWRVDSDGRTNIMIGLTAAGSQQFEALTAAHLKHQVAVLVDGRVLVAPVIQARLRSPDLSLPYEGNGPDLERLLKMLNQMNRPPVNLRLGPEQEAILPQLGGDLVMLSLRDHRLMTNANAEVESRAFHDWERENGADLMATASDRQIPILLGYDLATTPAVANGLGASSAADIMYNWDLMTVEPEARALLAKNPKTGRDTYYFRTRQDGWGVLQIIGFTGAANDVKIRYRLVQGHSIMVRF